MRKRLSTLYLVKRRQNMKAVVKTHELFISGYIPYFVNMEAAVKTHELFISGNIPYVINPFRKKYDKNSATLP